MTENKRVTPNLPKSMLNPSPAYVWQNSEHNLRHFRATQWLIHGVDVYSVKELLGHSSISTTMRYVHYVESHATRLVVEAQKKEAAGWKPTTQSVDTKWIHSK
jgi:site-specific recombinase XerD